MNGTNKMLLKQAYLALVREQPEDFAAIILFILTPLKIIHESEQTPTIVTDQIDAIQTFAEVLELACRDGVGTEILNEIPREFKGHYMQAIVRGIRKLEQEKTNETAR